MATFGMNELSCLSEVSCISEVSCSTLVRPAALARSSCIGEASSLGELAQAVSPKDMRSASSHWLLHRVCWVEGGIERGSMLGSERTAVFGQVVYNTIGCLKRALELWLTWRIWQGEAPTVWSNLRGSKWDGEGRSTDGMADWWCLTFVANVDALGGMLWLSGRLREAACRHRTVGSGDRSISNCSRVDVVPVLYS